MPILNNLEVLKPFTFYDSFSIRRDETAVRITLFQRCVGQDGRTFLETNMLGPGFLHPPQRFVVRGFKIEFVNFPMPWDIAEFARKISFQFIIGSRPYVRTPIRDLMEGSSVTSSSGFAIECGEPIYANINAEKAFSLDPEGCGIAGRLLMTGDLYRGIQ